MKRIALCYVRATPLTEPVRLNSELLRPCNTSDRTGAPDNTPASPTLCSLSLLARVFCRSLSPARFDTLDKDGSGEIDATELFAPLLSTGLARSAAEVERMVRVALTIRSSSSFLPSIFVTDCVAAYVSRCLIPSSPPSDCRF